MTGRLLFVCWAAGPRFWTDQGQLVHSGVIAAEPYQFCPENPDSRAGHTHPADHARCGWHTVTPEEEGP